jgi:pimeloyl-ACP methyl ester carboxylesterase
VVEIEQRQFHRRPGSVQVTGAQPTAGAEAVPPPRVQADAARSRTPDPQAIRRVVLVHGLWMPAASMRWLGARLARAGYRTEGLGYSTIFGGPEVAVPVLSRLIAREPCHVLAHSLGGLIAMQALREQPALPAGRVVCLGSPLCGSAAADGVAHVPLIGRLLGRSAGLLRGGCPPWDGRAEFGVVAGSRPLGLGQFFCRFDGDCDGTVAVAETRLPGLADHRVIRASHFGLLGSREAVTLALGFFETGRFHDGDAAAMAVRRGGIG